MTDVEIVVLVNQIVDARMNAVADHLIKTFGHIVSRPDGSAEPVNPAAVEIANALRPVKLP
jgi:hypothetical protein